MQTDITDCSNVTDELVKAGINNTSLANYLKAARRVIEKPENWTQGRLAKDSNGYEVCEASSTAVCFCAVGALRKVKYSSFGSDSVAFSEVFEYLRNFTPNSEPISYFNDSNPHSKVLELFDKAISAAELKQSNSIRIK